MKILFIKEKRSETGLEGIAIYLLNVCIELNRLGIEYLVLYNARDLFFNKMIESNINVNIVDLPPSSASNMLHKYPSVLRIRKVIHSIVLKEKITVINVHFPHLLGYVKNSWGVPIFGHWHGAFVENKPLKYVDRNNLLSLKKILNNIYKKHQVFNYSNAKKVICPSLAAKNTALKCFLVPENKIEINKYGLNKINPKEYKDIKKELGFNQNDKIILSAARETKSKGVEDFCNVALALKDKTNYKFVFLGGYKDKKYHDYLLEKYGDVVFFMGMRDDINDFYKSASLFLFLSHRESAGLVLAEAMFFSMPIIAWDIIGINEMFDNGINGYLCEFSNINQVVSNIQKILENDDIYQKFSNSSLIESKKHEIHQSVKNLIGLFELG
jgi:glycosyltransferase involved in cell wall biosynthesis